jgi:hypothetical protein
MMTPFILSLKKENYTLFTNMSCYMSLYTTVPEDKALSRIRLGHVGPCTFGAFSRGSHTGRWGGDWNGGVFSVNTIDDEDRDDLQDRFHLPRTLQTRIWITTDEVYEGQTDVYHMTAILLKEWEGDLALLNNGDYLRVQRVNGQISLRADYLNPERLVFYRDFDWKPLPEVKE